MLDKLLAMRVERIRDILFRMKAFHPFALHFADDLQSVSGDGVEGTHDGAVFDGPGGADVGDEVGEGGDGQAEVRFWTVLPFGG